MYDRRRYARFRILGGWNGTLRVLQDLTLERYAEGELWVLSADPARRDDVLELEIAGAGTVVGVKARVVAAEPVPNGGTVRHRLRLVVLEEQEQLEAIATAGVSATAAVQERS